MYDLVYADDTPTLGKLSMIRAAKEKEVKIIKTVAPSWESLGDQMEFDECGSQLELIEAKHPNDPEACCREMFKHWLKGNGVRPCSWRKLIDLLKDCNYKALADDVNSTFTTSC